MDRSSALAVLDRLHAAQNQFYAGRDGARQLETLLCPDVMWVVPGSSTIAGCYRGRAEVMAYFEHRRQLAYNTMRIIRRDALVGQGDFVASVSDGVRVGAGGLTSWRTVGLYLLRQERVAACWLVPIDPDEFDDVWGRR